MNPEFKKALAELFEVNANDLIPSFPLRAGDEWDSINFIATNALIDKYYGFMLNNDVLRKLATIDELEKRIDQHCQTQCYKNSHKLMAIS